MSTLVITGARVLDVRTGGYLDQRDVVVDHGTIVEVTPRATVHCDQTLDGRGLTLMPGLIDAHVHLAAIAPDLGQLPNSSPSYVAAFAIRSMKAMLRRGFTTVRDQGGADHGLARAQAEGLVTGPRIHFCGRALSQTGGHGDVRTAGQDLLDDHPCCPGIGRVADGVDAVRAAARDELRRGAHHLKVMASGGVASPTDRIDSVQYSVAELEAAVQEATAAHRYVAAHAYTPRAILRAVRAGVRTIEHGNLLDHDSVEAMVEHEAYLVPTLVTYQALAEHGPAHGFPDASMRKLDDVLTGGLAALELAARAGVRIAFGTDLLGPLQAYQSAEFQIRATVQDPVDIIRSATLVGAEVLGEVGRLGCVEEGAVADLLLVEGDPVQDISVLAEPRRHLRAVIQNGTIRFQSEHR
ncbi:MAG TPA: amidohydrolase family protein [Mycobacteriales bacterium]